MNAADLAGPVPSGRPLPSATEGGSAGADADGRDRLAGRQPRTRSETAPPIEVVIRIDTWTMSARARAVSRSMPKVAAIATAARSNVPRFDGPAGMADRERDARREQRRLGRSSAGRPSDWPAAANATTVAPHATKLSSSASASVRGRPATARPPWSRRPISRTRGQRSAHATTRSAPGRRCAASPTARATTSRPVTASADEHRARDEAADVEDEDRDTDAIATTTTRVDDPLDDDRPERRRPADPLAVAEVVAPDELAEPRRQDVVRRGSRSSR